MAEWLGLYPQDSDTRVRIAVSALNNAGLAEWLGLYSQDSDTRVRIADPAQKKRIK